MIKSITIVFVTIITFIILFFVSSSVAGQVQVVLDTDIGGDADDLGAITMLHNLKEKGECEVLGIISWSTEKYAIPAIDALNRYYNHPEIPIATRKSAEMNYMEWNYNRVVADGLGYQLTYEDVPDAVTLYRQILQNSDDSSIVIVTIGPLKNIEVLLASAPDSISILSGIDLVHRKVKEFVIMGGQFPSGKWEWNFNGGMPGVTKKVLEQIEVPITFLGYEVGLAIKTGNFLNEIDPNHPLYMGYFHFSKNASWMKEYFEGKILDNSSYDQTAVLYAVRNELGNYWNKIEKGRCLPDMEGGNTWAKDKNANHFYLVLEEKIPEIAQTIEKLMLGK